MPGSCAACAVVNVLACSDAIPTGSLQMDAFDYHPEFKRFHDKFSAVPFRPKKAESPPKHATSADELANTAKRRKASMAHSKKLQR